MIEILIEGMTNNKGGKESYIINIYKTFNKSKFRLSFVAYDDQIAYEDILLSNGVDVIHLPPRSKGLFQFRKAINKLFSNKRFDVLWAHKTTLSSCEILELAKKHEVPLIIVHSHSSSNMGGMQTYILHSINKLLVRSWANEYFACSDTAASWFFGSKSCKQMKNGIDVEKFRFNSDTRQRIRKELGIEGYFVIGHVGRFGIEKNHKKLINVFNEVHKINEKSRLVLCGDGEERRNIETQIKDLGLQSNVLLLGIINNVDEVLQAMDVIVMPSFFEGLPFALLEAQSTGLKCVVSDTISQESDIIGWNEFLPVSANDKVWAKKICGMNFLYDRSTAAERITQAGYNVIDCARCVESIIEYYIK